MTEFDFRDMFSGATTADSDEAAKKAVAAFRGMQPVLSAYAQMITGNSAVTVVAHPSSNGMTDGKRIFYRPPMALGNMTPHQRQLCDKRDDTKSLLCPACFVREEVMAGVYHEISHIANGSFTPPTTDELGDMVVEIGRNYGFGFAAEVAKRVGENPGYSHLGVLVSPFMHMLWNAVEDSRIDQAMFAARPGTRVMFDAAVNRTMSKGFETRRNGKYSITKWNEQPLNAQVTLGIFLLTSDYEYAKYLDERVVQALDDSQIQYLAAARTDMKSAADSFRLAFRILVRLRELGFLKSDNDPKEEKDDSDTSEESGGEGEGDQTSSPADGDDESTEPSASGGTPDDNSATDPGSEGASSEDQDGEAGGDQQGGQDGDPQSGAQPDQGGADPKDSSSDVDEGSAGADDTDAADGSDDTDAGSDAVSAEEGASSSEGDADGSEPGGDSGSSDGADGGGESSGGTDSGRTGRPVGEDRGPETEAGRDGSSQPDGAVDEPSSDQPESSESTDAAEGERDSSPGPSQPDSEPAGEAADGPTEPGADSVSGGAGAADPASDAEGHSAPGLPGDTVLDGDKQPDASDEDGSGQPVPDSAPSDDGEVGGGEDRGDSDDADSGDGDGVALDTGSAASHGTTLVNEEIEGLPEDMGDEKDVELTLIKVHEDEIPNEVDMKAAEVKAIDKAIIQSMWFETGSKNILMVREHKFGQPSTTIDGHTWNLGWPSERSSRATREQRGIDGDFRPDETVLGPSLLRMRVAFADNRRSKIDRDRKSGRVDARVLGRRAWKGDDERLFGKKTIAKKKDYFVIIAIDISSSTTGRNLVLAKRAAYAQAELCNRLGIKFAIYAHSAQIHNQKDWSSGIDVEMLLVKTADEPWNKDAQKRFEEIPPVAANLDGHALEYFRKVADSRPESQVVILYYSDGKMPAENHDEELVILKREIKKCKHNGHVLVGVGIRTDSPREHGLDTVEVNEDADIVKVVRHLETRLLAV